MASTSMAAAKPQRKPRLVYPKLGIPFILLVLCFAAWGSAANLTDVLVSVFRSIFTMSNFHSALVQFAYYGAYFSLAIPAALINRRFGYKTGLLAGVGFGALGVVSAGDFDPVSARAVPDDLSARDLPADQAALPHGGAWGGPVRGGHVLPEHDRPVRRRRHLVVIIADVSNDLRCCPARDGPGRQVRGGRPGAGDLLCAVRPAHQPRRWRAGVRGRPPLTRGRSNDTQSRACRPPIAMPGRSGGRRRAQPRCH